MKTSSKTSKDGRMLTDGYINQRFISAGIW